MGRTRAGRDPVTERWERFEDIVADCYPLVDKTGFIADWWRSGDAATLICRPNGFGKTLNLTMLECFFSMRHERDGAQIFQGFSIYDDLAMNLERGSWPVISLSFARVGMPDFNRSLDQIRRLISRAYQGFLDSVDLAAMTPHERAVFEGRSLIGERELPCSLTRLCELVHRGVGKRPIILLDDYDVPMRQAWLHGYWDEMAGVLRNFYINTFKANSYLRRAVLTGVTCLARDAAFGDLNNLAIVTAETNQYGEWFGLTDSEVRETLRPTDLGGEGRQLAKAWYGGFSFGRASGIYSPPSILNYRTWYTPRSYRGWTPDDALLVEILRRCNAYDREDWLGDIGTLLQGGKVARTIDARVALNGVVRNPDAFWSFLFANGYVRRVSPGAREYGKPDELAVTNLEMRETLASVVGRV